MRSETLLRFLAISLAVFLTVTGAQAVHQMDMRIGKTRSNIDKGDDIYGNPRQQTISVRLRRQAKFFFRAQHDLTMTNGTSMGRARILLSESGRDRLRLKVFHLKGSRKDVTAAITGGGYRLPVFESEDTADFLVKVRPPRNSTKRRISLNFEKLKIIGILVSLAERSRDRVEARIARR